MWESQRRGRSREKDRKGGRKRRKEGGREEGTYLHAVSDESRARGRVVHLLRHINTKMRER